MMKDAHVFDYSKFVDAENWLSSLGCRYHVYESYTKGKRKSVDCYGIIYILNWV